MGKLRSFKECSEGSTSRANVARLFLSLGLFPAQDNEVICVFRKSAMSMRDVEKLFSIFINNVSCYHSDGEKVTFPGSLHDSFGEMFSEKHVN